MTVSIQQLIRFFGLERDLTDEKGNSNVNDAIMDDVVENTDSTFTPPSCPHCQSGGRVDCAECGEEWMACTCPDVTDTWWCPLCGSTWDQDVLEVGNDDNDYLSGDKLDELIDDIRQQAIEREKNKVAVATFEAGKNAAAEKPSDEVIAKGCQCADPKVYFCMTCHVKRKTSSDPWEWYSDEPTTTTTTTPELDKPSDDIIALGCQCDPAKSYFCPTCHVKRNTLTTPWIWWPHKTQWLATTTYVSKCRHYELPLVMPDGTIVYGSSKWDRKETDHVPDLGVYLDSMWKPASVAYMIAWPDYGIPTWNDAAIATIQSAYEYAKTGAFVEVGCIGGHGRTGTVLACMAVLGGVNPLEAVKYVHDNYCTEAIESDRQEWWIEFFAHSVGLLDTLRPAPTAKTYGYGGGHGTIWDYDEWEYDGSSSSTSKVCQVSDHYVDWKAHEECTCQYWEKDLNEFLEGKFPQNHLELNKKADARVKARLNGAKEEEKKQSASSQMLTTGQFNELMCHCGQKYTDCGCTNRTLAKCQHDDCVQYREVVATAIATEAAETNAAKLSTPEFSPSDPTFVPPVSWVNHGIFGSHNEVAAKTCIRCLHPEGWIRHANYSHSFNYTKDCKQCERDENAKITVEEAADKVAAEIIKKHDIRSDVRCVRPGCNTFLLTNALTCDKCGLLYSDGFWKSLDPASMEPRVGTVTDGWYYLGPEAGWVAETNTITDEPATHDSL